MGVFGYLGDIIGMIGIPYLAGFIIYFIGSRALKAHDDLFEYIFFSAVWPWSIIVNHLASLPNPEQKRERTIVFRRKEKWWKFWQ